MNEGAVTYEIRADDSKLDSDLSAAESKVKKSAKETNDYKEEYEKDTSDVIKKEQEDVTEHHKEQNKEREESDEESHSKRQESAKKHGDTLKNIAGGTAKAIGAGMLAAGAAAVTVGATAVDAANDMQQAMNQYIASTGKGVEETERYQTVLENIYKNNYGEDFSDISRAMAEVDKQLGEMSDEQLQTVTESAFALRDVFEYDIAESTRAAKAMVDNFGISGDEAMNLIAAGAQNGLDYSGELLDSISEYSVQFAKVGLDADDMFKIFQKGAESGAFNLDKVGDAVKEMSIRVIDGSETTKQGFADIGLDADAMADKFAAGGDSAKAAFQETIAALAKVKDPLKQNAAGVALFGTQWEDLGADAVTALASIEDGAYDTGNAMESIKEVKYDDLSSMLEGLRRSVELLLIPLGEMLIPVLTEVIQEILPAIEEVLPPLLDVIGEIITAMSPIISDIIPALVELLGELITPMVSIIEEIMPMLVELFEAIAPVLMDLISNIMPILVELFTALIPPIVEIVSALLPPLLSIINALLPILELFISLLQPILDLFVQLLDPIVNLIETAITPLIEIIAKLLDTVLKPLIPIVEAVAKILADALGGAIEGLIDPIGNIIAVFESLIDFIKNVFSGNWAAAWKNIKDIFSNFADAIGGVFKVPINFIIDGINGFIDGINKIEIPDYVPVVGGKGFNILKIPRLKVGMDYVPSDFFPAFLDEGEAVLTKEENFRFRTLGGLAGIEYKLSSGQSSLGEPMDYERMGKEMAKVLDGTTVTMDKKVVGKLITPIVNDELERERQRKT
ncbi:MAG: hypothetical protein E7269_04770 [Lachnospiraceae bacterium]|nr:hypothetical protein [Lachnospiraceae bacterium]